MKFHTAVAIKGHFNAQFTDLQNLKDGDDRIPGRELAELIYDGLNRFGLEVSPAENEEPFFIIPCKSGDLEYRIFCYLYQPNGDPVWVVDCPRKLGIIARWLGKSEEQELGKIVVAIQKTLKMDPRIKDFRWFANMPDAPFEQIKYADSPDRGQ